MAGVDDRGLICGVDLGVAYAVFAYLDPRHGDYAWHTIRTRLTGPEAARDLHLQALAELARRPLTTVWLERPMGPHAKSVSNLSRTLGAIAAAVPLDVGVSEITPHEWHRLVGLPLDKAEVVAWAIDETGAGSIDSHEAESYAIARACLVESLGFYHLEAVGGDTWRRKPLPS